MAVGTYALITLQQLKDWLGETGSSNDSHLERVIDATTARIETYIGREIKARDRVEFHDGNVRTLRLSHFPVNSCAFIGWGRQNVMQITSNDRADISATASITSQEPHTTSRGLLLTRVDSTGTQVQLTKLLSSYPTVTLLAAEVAASVGWGATALTDFPSKYLHRMGPADAKDGDIIITAPSRRAARFRMDSLAGTIEFPNGFNNDDWEELDEEWGCESQVVVVDYNSGYSTVPADIADACLQIAAAAWRARFMNANVQSETLDVYSYTSAVRDASLDLLDNLLGGWKEIR